MKIFLKDIASEWKPLLFFPKYQYSKNNVRYFWRRTLTLLNKELSAIVINIFNSPMHIIIVATILFCAIFLPLTFGLIEISSFLDIAANVLVSFISLLVASAIFISTIHRQSSNKSVEEDMKFLEVINKNRNTLCDVFHKYNELATGEEKAKLFMSTPCDSVIDYEDYDKYKVWHQNNVGYLGDVIFPGYEYLRYPYNVAANATAYSRTYLMIDGCNVANNLLSKSKEENSILKKSVRDMSNAAKRFQTSGTRGYYIPVEFAGQRLYRVIGYSLIALALVALTLLFKNYSLNLIPDYDFNLIDNIYRLAVAATLLSVYLTLRYVFKFIFYLRDSTSYNASILNNTYIYEPDNSMKAPGTAHYI